MPCMLHGMRSSSFLLDLLYPPYCESCRKVLTRGEVLCDECLSCLTLTEHGRMRDNKLEALFADIRKFERGAAWCFYDDDSVVLRLIHSLKYYSRPSIGEWIGMMAAEEMRRQNPLFFEGMDVVVPVPLHKNKERERGYNQSELIARGVARACGLPLDTHSLVRVIDNQTQTRLSKEERLENTRDIFALSDKESLRGKHVLLVDDVVTTGATIRDCMRCLSPLRGTRFSVLSAAVAGNLSSQPFTSSTV